VGQAGQPGIAPLPWCIFPASKRLALHFTLECRFNPNHFSTLLSSIPTTITHTFQLAHTLFEWAEWRTHHGRCHHAVPLLREAAGIMRSLGNGAVNLAPILSALGESLAALGMRGEAEAELREGVGLALDTRRLDPSVLPIVRANTLEARVVDVLVEMGRVAEALEEAQVAEHELRERERLDRSFAAWDRDRLLMTLATAFMAAGQHEKVKEIMHIVFQTFKWQRGGVTECNVRTKVIYGVLSAELCFLEKRSPTEAAVEVEKMLGWLVRSYEFTVEEGLMASSFGARKYPKLLQLLARAKAILGREGEARRLEGEVNEIEALAEALSQAALVELRAELREERAAATGGAASAVQPGGQGQGQGQGQRTKLTHKQQKRRAAARRKAEARAAAEDAAAAAGAGTGAGGEGEAAAGTTDAQSEEEEEEAEAQEEEPEPKPEPEECAICLEDLPAAGAVLLACSHSFHADCLERWKGKCLEKGLRFTCGLCRAVCVVP
jgi:pyruvate/2-oxoglutarate dehydrogenase complex dihydrolipoamide acyltransferase (E2) component